MFPFSVSSGKLAQKSLMMKLMDKVVCSGARAYDKSNFPAVHYLHPSKFVGKPRLRSNKVLLSVSGVWWKHMRVGWLWVSPSQQGIMVCQQNSGWYCLDINWQTTTPGNYCNKNTTAHCKRFDKNMKLTSWRIYLERLKQVFVCFQFPEKKRSCL